MAKLYQWMSIAAAARAAATATTANKNKNSNSSSSNNSKNNNDNSDNSNNYSNSDSNNKKHFVLGCLQALKFRLLAGTRRGRKRNISNIALPFTHHEQNWLNAHCCRKTTATANIVKTFSGGTTTAPTTITATATTTTTTTATTTVTS